MPKLEQLLLSNTLLTTLGDLSKCTKLRVIACQRCRLGVAGKQTWTLDALRANVALEMLDLGLNKVGGSVPAFFGALTALKVRGGGWG